MAKKMQGKKFELPVPFSATDVIQKPQLYIETEGYAVGEREYGILTQWYWVDFLKPFAYGSFGVFLTQAYNLITYFFQIYRNIEDTEEMAKLKECQEYEIGRTIIILITSVCVFVGLLIINKIINKYRPTKKNSLFKDIRYILDRTKKVTARKREEKNSD